MRRHSPGYHSPPRRGYGGRGRSPPRRGHGGRREQNNGSLLVRNIPLSCRPEDLRVPFERYGPVRDVYMPKDYYSGEPRGFAFVQFVDPLDASEAQYHMNRKQFGGREITVVVAAETRKKPDEMRNRDRVRAPSGYDSRRSHGRHRSLSPSRSRSRSPRRRTRERSRSGSPAPRRRGDDSPSPRRRGSDRLRSPRDHARSSRGHDDDRRRRSNSADHSGGGGANQNRTDNDVDKKASHEAEGSREGSRRRSPRQNSVSPPPRRTSVSPPGSRRRSPRRNSVSPPPRRSSVLPPGSRSRSVDSSPGRSR